jgi:hypothetical protein
VRFYKACDVLVAIALMPVLLYGLKTAPWLAAGGLLLAIFWPRTPISHYVVSWFRQKTSRTEEL